MRYEVRYTDEARDDLFRLTSFLRDVSPDAAARALETIIGATAILEQFPFTCRKADPTMPFHRELVVPFGSGGYVALYAIGKSHVSIIAIRHQREDDFFF
ncbi:type II toxin-antitoxin system RelE/ParE family toxin [Luteibacter aegosomatissinici]|uniref:type II toxin-antitoxin system RelE/ParE family toxin n=1 Tax=Luteibacter aegosomatissinici TaxID=2911539 RepID=UPI001FF824A6|nr:type II toxin-antitoxin system RelE/ParE family toxin [Luteibacter aegosomatissinici]UPG94690.1 type II toxin-antitoxin system RelE/ParE family toxin [Luteibacter aegosomatissinici]